MVAEFEIGIILPLVGTAIVVVTENIGTIENGEIFHGKILYGRHADVAHKIMSYFYR